MIKEKAFPKITSKLSIGIDLLLSRVLQELNLIWGYVFLGTRRSPSYKQAVYWYRLAAEQGVARAQYDLGLMYFEGKGVPQDYKQAVYWYRLAAEQGYADAQSSLGAMYDIGQGVLQDYPLAHMWYNIAAMNGVIWGAKNRERVAKEMTPAQIEEAQSLARQCVEQEYH